MWRHHVELIFILHSLSDDSDIEVMIRRVELQFTDWCELTYVRDLCLQGYDTVLNSKWLLMFQRTFLRQLLVPKKSKWTSLTLSLEAAICCRTSLNIYQSDIFISQKFSVLSALPWESHILEVLLDVYEILCLLSGVAEGLNLVEC